MSNIKKLIYEENFVIKYEEKYLINIIDKLQQNNALSRRTQHYSYEYNYNNRLAKKIVGPS